MTRGSFRRSLAFLLAVPFAASLASCGSGGGGGGSRPMQIEEFLFVDETLTPSFPTGTTALPRNARIVMRFSDDVDPSSVNEQTIQIRKEPIFQTVPLGSFQVDGNRVIFDPTITKSGQPNPFGFDPFSQYVVFLPSIEDREVDPETAVVENSGNDPLLTSFQTTFKTNGSFLRELEPPTVEEVFFVPDPDILTQQVPGNGFIGIRFSEAMDPASFRVSTVTPAPEPTDTVDIRYDCNDAFNILNDVDCRPIPMNEPTHNPAADTYFFRPIFSLGAKKYIFNVAVMQGLTDLAGNLLVNPRSFGPFKVDGTGLQDGQILNESFTSVTDRDSGLTDADWGVTDSGTLQGAEITSRRAFITCWQQILSVQPTYTGQYYALVDPLVGPDLNQVVPGINPPTASGRRVMWSFSDQEMGPDGSITTMSWGPDSNATFAAKYPSLTLRMGFQKTAQMNLAGTFSGNYLGAPLTVFNGVYDVVQAANVGNSTEAGAEAPTKLGGQVAPLFNFWGYTNWPAPTSFFDWDEGDPAVIQDRVFVFDASAAEGSTWQQFRGWFAWAIVGVSLISGFPNRRMLSTHEEDAPNPAPNPALGVLNPEPSITDTAFTLTKRVSVGQSRFYTPDPVDAGGNIYPAPYSSQRTYGVKSDYLDAVLTPSLQAGGATVLAEFQGAIALDPTSARTKINTSFASTDWTSDIDDCDTFPYIRWRLTLTSNLNSLQVAKVENVAVPLLQLP